MQVHKLLQVNHYEEYNKCIVNIDAALVSKAEILHREESHIIDNNSTAQIFLITKDVLQECSLSSSKKSG